MKILPNRKYKYHDVYFYHKSTLSKYKLTPKEQPEHINIGLVYNVITLPHQVLLGTEYSEDLIDEYFQQREWIRYENTP